MGGRLHRVLLDPPGVRRHHACVGADLGRGRRAQPGLHVRPAARLRRAGRHRAVVRRAARAEHGEPPYRAGPLADPLRLRGQQLSPHDGLGRHRAGPALLRRRRDPVARRGLRHHLRLRGPLLSAPAVPVALLQQAHGRLRRQLREPGALLARDARAGARGGRRHLRDRLALRRRRPRPDRRQGRRGRRAVRRARRPPRRRLGPHGRQHRRVGPERGTLTVLRPGPRAPRTRAR